MEQAGVIFSLVALFAGIAAILSTVSSWLLVREQKSIITTLLRQQQKLLMVAKTDLNVAGKDVLDTINGVPQSKIPADTQFDDNESEIAVGPKRFRLFGINQLDANELAQELKKVKNDTV